MRDRRIAVGGNFARFDSVSLLVFSGVSCSPRVRGLCTHLGVHRRTDVRIGRDPLQVRANIRAPIVFVFGHRLPGPLRRGSFLVFRRWRRSGRTPGHARDASADRCLARNERPEEAQPDRAAAEVDVHPPSTARVLTILPLFGCWFVAAFVGGFSSPVGSACVSQLFLLVAGSPNHHLQQPAC